MSKPTLASLVTYEHLRHLDENTTKSFWEDVDVRDNPHDCWEWKRGQSNYYGRINIPGFITGQGRAIMLHAHRVALALHLGHLVPADMQVDHACRNTLCCNPHHLRIVTPRQNTSFRRLTAEDYQREPCWGLSEDDLVRHPRVPVQLLPHSAASSRVPTQG